MESQLRLYLRFANIYLVYLAFNLTFNCSQAGLQHVWGIASKSCAAICCNFLFEEVFHCISVCRAAPLYAWKSLELHFTVKQKFHRLWWWGQCFFSWLYDCLTCLCVYFCYKIWCYIWITSFCSHVFKQTCT